MATDAPTLLADAKCDLCNSPSEYSLLLEKVSLLKQILLAHDPMADTSPQALLAAAKCYHCYAANPFMLLLIELGLLKQLVESGGGGGGAGGTWIVWEDTGPNPAGPPADPTKPVMVRFRDGNPPVVWDPDAGAYV